MLRLSPYAAFLSTSSAPSFSWAKFARSSEDFLRFAPYTKFTCARNDYPAAPRPWAIRDERILERPAFVSRFRGSRKQSGSARRCLSQAGSAARSSSCRRGGEARRKDKGCASRRLPESRYIGFPAAPPLTTNTARLGKPRGFPLCRSQPVSAFPASFFFFLLLLASSAAAWRGSGEVQRGGTPCCRRASKRALSFFFFSATPPPHFFLARSLGCVQASTRSRRDCRHAELGGGLAVDKGEGTPRLGHLLFFYILSQQI